MAQMDGPKPRPSLRATDQFETQYQAVIDRFKEGDLAYARAAAQDLSQRLQSELPANDPKITRALILQLRLERYFGGNPQLAATLESSAAGLSSKIAELEKTAEAFLDVPVVRLLQADAYHELARNYLDPRTVTGLEGVYDFPKAEFFNRKSALIRKELEDSGRGIESSVSALKPKICALMIAEARGNKSIVAEIAKEILTAVGDPAQLRNSVGMLRSNPFEFLEIAECLDALGCVDQMVVGIDRALARFNQARNLRARVLTPEHPLLGLSDHLIGKVHFQAGSPEMAQPRFSAAHTGLKKINSAEVDRVYTPSLAKVEIDIVVNNYQLALKSYRGNASSEIFFDTVEALGEIRGRLEKSQACDPATMVQIITSQISICLQLAEAAPSLAQSILQSMPNLFASAKKWMSKAMSLDSGSIQSFRAGLLARLEGYVSSRDTGEQLRNKLQKLELAVDILSKSVSPYALVVEDTMVRLDSGWTKLDPHGKEAAHWKEELQKLRIKRASIK